MRIKRLRVQIFQIIVLAIFVNCVIFILNLQVENPEILRVVNSVLISFLIGLILKYTLFERDP